MNEENNKFENNKFEKLLNTSDTVGRDVDELREFLEGDGVESISNNEALLLGLQLKYMYHLFCQSYS
jgi:ATP-dependent exoDNAse (exonuclease V) alpha subunit